MPSSRTRRFHGRASSRATGSTGSARNIRARSPPPRPPAKSSTGTRVSGTAIREALGGLGRKRRAVRVRQQRGTGFAARRSPAGVAARHTRHCHVRRLAAGACLNTRRWGTAFSVRDAIWWRIWRAPPKPPGARSRSGSSTRFSTTSGTTTHPGAAAGPGRAIGAKARCRASATCARRARPGCCRCRDPRRARETRGRSRPRIARARHARRGRTNRGRSRK